MARAMTFATADLSDAHPDAQAAEIALLDFGGIAAFHGPVATLKVFEDNALVRESLEEAGRGRVLVVDGGGSRRCALLGGNLAQLAVRNGWAGIVINGCVRDVAEMSTLAVGVKALGTSPRRSEKGLHGGQRDRPVRFAGVKFEPGSWVYADQDGLLVAERRLHPEN
jgi:regulator of ribonuclease activity A